MDIATTPKSFLTANRAWANPLRLTKIFHEPVNCGARHSTKVKIGKDRRKTCVVCRKRIAQYWKTGMVILCLGNGIHCN
jgi:hypothetical protein